MQLSEVWIALIVFIFAGFILYLLAARNRAQLRYRMEVQKELIAKFSSSGELAEFLNSDAGKLLVSGTRIDYSAQVRHPPKAKTAKEIVAMAIAWGVLILAVGVAIFMTRGLTTASALFMAVGVGFEINAFLGYILSKRWGTWELTVAEENTRIDNS